MITLRPFLSHISALIKQVYCSLIVLFFNKILYTKIELYGIQACYFCIAIEFLKRDFKFTVSFFNEFRVRQVFLFSLIP